MGAFDWLTQTVSKAGDWLKQNVTPENISKGISWANQNIVQPAVSVARNIPGVGTVADAIGQGANAIDSLGKKVAGGGVTLKDVTDTAGQLKNSYSQARQGMPAAREGIVNEYNNIKNAPNVGSAIKRGIDTVAKYGQPLLKRNRTQFS